MKQQKRFWELGLRIMTLTLVVSVSFQQALFGARGPTAKILENEAYTPPGYHQYDGVEEIG